MTAHAEKHHEGAGTGIRTLAEVISEFEKKVSFLAKKLLSDPQKTIAGIHSLREKELSELHYILTSGTYGTQENGVISRMRKLEGKGGRVTAGMKLRYYMSRTFPSQDFLYPYYPLARFKVFVPLVWVFRILRGVTFRAKKIFTEIRLLDGFIYHFLKSCFLGTAGGFLFHLPLVMFLATSSFLGNDGQPVFLTEPVIYPLDFVEQGKVIVEFSACHATLCGTDDEVVMEMFFIPVGGTDKGIFSMK